MRLVQVKSSQLKPGMFVAELDRPWLETPFSLQGFTIRDDEDIAYVSRYVESVYVDIDYVGSDVSLPYIEADNGAKNTNGLHIKKEFDKAKLSFEHATQAMEKAFQSIRRGEDIDMQKIRAAVKPIINNVLNNKDASAILTRMRHKGEYLYNHSVGMAVWSAILGHQLGLMPDAVENLVTGCAMCDVGMSLLPDELYHQPSALKPNQKALIISHPLQGADYVRKSGEFDAEILSIIEQHHERHDGSGYPKGLSTNGITLSARIAGLVDTYDAMINCRPYARQRTSFDATQELLDNSDKLFQGVLVEQFIQAIGLFPVGALVELNNGEVAIVVKQNETRKLRPEIVIILDSNKKPKTMFDLVDLFSLVQGTDDDLWITRELPPGTYGIHPEDHFF